MAASLRATATRILRPARFPGEGVRRLSNTHQLSKHTGALEEGYQRACQIKETKEELYNLIAKDVASSVASRPDRLLLKRLCTQVEPRPNDPQWCKLTRNKKMLGYTVTAGLVVRPKVVNYHGYLVTTESLTMLQERLRQQAGYQPAAAGGWGGGGGGVDGFV